MTARTRADRLFRIIMVLSVLWAVVFVVGLIVLAVMS